MYDCFDIPSILQQQCDAIRRAVKYPNPYPSKPPAWHENVLIDGTMCSVQGTTEEARADLISQGQMTYVEYGRWVNRWWSRGMLVDGCGAGMKQMSALLAADNADAVIAQMKGECCGDTLDERTGKCPRCGGLCPLVRDAGRILREETGE